MRHAGRTRSTWVTLLTLMVPHSPPEPRARPGCVRRTIPHEFALGQLLAASGAARLVEMLVAVRNLVLRVVSPVEFQPERRAASVHVVAVRAEMVLHPLRTMALLTMALLTMALLTCSSRARRDRALSTTYYGTTHYATN
jgi:hypothetical protein